MNDLVCPECGSVQWEITDEIQQECHCGECGLDFDISEAPTMDEWEQRVP